MAASRSSPGPVFFESAAAFQAWLEEHSSHEPELLVGFYKVGSLRPSMTWPEAVDEALCFGWIDGVRRRIDEHSYQIRFTPRKARSVWSAVNIAKANKLISQGRMRPAGMAAFSRRSERKSGIYSYEQSGALDLTPAESRQFKRSKHAWEYFEQAPPGYRRMVLHWLASAKRPETRRRRLVQLMEACAAGQRLFR